MLFGLLVGLSCSGPSSDTQAPSQTETPDRLYHVQLDMMKDKAVANQRLAEAISWVEKHPSVSAPTPVESEERSIDSPVRIVWRAPFYRVRLGPYRSQSEAEEVLLAVRSAFPDAFVAPERFESAQ